jgi:hypothetical protein
MAIEEADVPRLRDVAERLTDAKNSKHSVVEALGALYVVRADHHMTEHDPSPDVVVC